MTTPANPATNVVQDPQAVAERAAKAKATVEKHNSILFKIKLQDAKGNHVPVYEVANKTIGFFCGTGRLGVCQELAVLVDRFLEQHPKFTVIYISYDSSKEAFNRTLEAHPRWLAVPYDEGVRLDILNEWQMKGLPCLHVYDPVEHEIVTSWGGSCLRFNFDKCFDEWQYSEGVTFWQIIKGYFTYKSPPGTFVDMTDADLIANGFPSSDTESKKDK
ncbi:Nucleoredoxin-like protein 2 [Dissophora globulifera]|nr:Nucleoredoxin-like protein 2 [Dissophora globulifera]